MDLGQILPPLIAAVVAGLVARYKQRSDSPDGRALAALHKSALDPSAPQDLRFRFDAASRAAVDALAEQLRLRGFVPDLPCDLPDGGAELTATKRMLPRLGALLELRKRLARMAYAHGCRYDGWAARRSTQRDVPT